MEKNNFGRELEGRAEFVLTLDEYKDLMLYHLEDYLFHTKFNDKVTNINIPALGINFSTEQRYALDLRRFFDIPQISFDEKGCFYSNGKEIAYISSEFFAKCFVERVVDVLISISKLYLPKKLMDESKKNEPRDFDLEKPKKDKMQLQHIDFVDAYNKLVGLKRLNNDLTQGLIGLGPSFNNSNTITSLRKIEVGAKIQKDIVFVLDEISKEIYENESYAFNNDAFWQSEEYKELKKEHERLFSNGPFIAPLEQPEWETKGRTYDEGTDEEREAWRIRYEKSKKEFEEKGLDEIKSGITQRLFSLQKIQNRVIDYLKRKIYLYDYRMYQAPPGNPYINELGLDQTAYYAHPADKYLPEKLSRIITSDDLMDATAEDYDMLYGNVSDGEYDEFGEDYSSSGYRKL